MYFVFLLVIVIFISILMIWPGIVFAYAWYTNNFSLQNIERSEDSITDPSGFDNLPDFKKFYDQSAKKDCINGYYLGENDSSGGAICNFICDGNDNEFEYKYISPGQQVVINRKSLESGAWCLPKDIARCNLNISYALSGIDSYQCLTAFPSLLGGTTGNKIVGCTPFNSIVDKRTGSVYMSFVPHDFRIDDINERLSDGSFRYQCDIPSNVANYYQTLSDLGLGGRFQLIHNSCGVFDSDGRLSASAEKCICSNMDVGSVYKDSQANETFKPCTTCTSGYGIIDELFPQKGSKYGVSLGIDCVDPTAANFLESNIAKMPCGLNVLSIIRQTEKISGCHRALIDATGSYSLATIEDLEG